MGDKKVQGARFWPSPLDWGCRWPKMAWTTPIGVVPLKFFGFSIWPIFRFTSEGERQLLQEGAGVAPISTTTTQGSSLVLHFDLKREIGLYLRFSSGDGPDPGHHGLHEVVNDQ
ncbi:hypothetical protein CRG98_003438 [Punica granatum]|uniref:Uncharacterized protein n=1 Tax=Punica granatum TaxID=22663 RepID=A0A2I0L5T2_PUNGR|nr:hypothetical protein CRG98_003438 [Punica granatum]